VRFELSHDRRNISDDDILTDMRQAAMSLDSHVLRQKDYKSHGKYAVRTAIRRFGSWASAVEQAGLTKSVDRKISEEQLFENILDLWTQFGQQPSYSDVHAPQSEYNVTTYERRFGSWRDALEAFVGWANQENHIAPMREPVVASTRCRTPRSPDLRLRFKVLQRDRFTCCTCGVSPATTPGTVLQIDHIQPWSKGGATKLDNLQALCNQCNIGKSDLPMNEKSQRLRGKLLLDIDIDQSRERGGL